MVSVVLPASWLMQEAESDREEDLATIQKAADAAALDKAPFAGAAGIINGGDFQLLQSYALKLLSKVLVRK